MAKEKNMEKNKKNAQQDNKKKKRKRWPLVTIPILLLLVAALGYYFFAPPTWPYSAKALREQQKQHKAQQENLLEQENAELRAALSELENQNRQLASQIEQLNQRLTEQQSQTTAQRTAAQAEAYQRLRTTAQLFADMSPSKAVPILQAMPQPEAALILKAMNDKDRGRLLTRFKPETAARLTLALQQISPLDETSDLDSIREQLTALLPELPEETNTATERAQEMALTFSAMDAGAAADILTRWWSLDRQGTLAILKAMGPDARAQLLSELEADVATEIGWQLMQNAS